MAARKAKVEFYWMTVRKTDGDRINEREAGVFTSSPLKHVVNWRLIGANGEVMCQCTQGFRDKTDAMRNVTRCGVLLANAGGGATWDARITGPGRKPT